MKNFFVCFIMLYSISAQPQSGWFVQPVPISSYMWEVTMIDVNTIFISADGGRVLKTTNAGTNWVISVLPTATDLFAIDFPSASIGYTAGAQGKIFKTTNTGSSWIPLPSPTVNEILSVKFINEITGYIGGGPSGDGEIFKTTNGGSNWTEYGPGVIYPQVVSMNFPGDNIGYAAGINGMIMKTSNGGVNWNLQQTGLGNVTFFSVFFTNDNTGYLTTPFPGNILKTTNGGTNWNSIYNNTDHFTVSVFFVNPDTGFVTGASGKKVMVMKTINAGVNWTLELLDFDGHLNSINFVNHATGYIAGDEGRLYKTTNGGVTVGIANNTGQVPDAFMLYQNYPNPFNPQTVISYQLPASRGEAVSSFVSLKVYDILGKEVMTLVDQKQNAGSYEIEFTSSDLCGGIYFYTLESQGITQSKKMVLLK